MQETSALSAKQPATSFTSLTPPGEWPKAAGDLPLLLSQREFAHLRAVSPRTLQRERRQGSPVPFRRLGRRVLYPRAGVLAFFGIDAA